MDKTDNISDLFRVGLVLVDGFALMSYAAVVEPLRVANLKAGKPIYEVRHMPAIGARAVSSSGAIVGADTYLGEHMDFDLVLVVAGSDYSPSNAKRLYHWLRLLASRRVMIGGVSAGPLILARAGVMDGHRITVHWDHEKALREVSTKFVLENSAFVRDRGRLSCAGGMAAMDMMLSIIAEHHQAELAQRVGDWFNHHSFKAEGNSQRESIGKTYEINNLSVIKAIQAMENHLHDPLSLDQISQAAGLSSRQTNRLFREHLGSSAAAFYFQLRINKARSLLHRSPLSINDIASATGFGSSAYFSKQYRQVFAVSPSQCRREGSRSTEKL